MTKPLRAKVVELLRCAADNNEWIDTFGFAATRQGLGYQQGGLVQATASTALLDVIGSVGDDWQLACLETARQVEEGRWP